MDNRPETLEEYLPLRFAEIEADMKAGRGEAYGKLLLEEVFELMTREHYGTLN